MKDSGTDPARISFKFFDVVDKLQHCVTSIEKLRVPVIAAISGFAIGAGVDISATCDIRIASKTAKFSIKEVDVGLAADIGTI
jgi:delta(3,5)-delta(2,4)-dienoyl-CoA isomerase